MARTIVWFSCGAASAVAAKLILQESQEAILARCVVESEHPDNWRFARDVSKWLNHPIVELTHPKYKDSWSVFEGERFLNGPHGAKCTVILKKRVRKAFEQDGDIHIFGFTKNEEERASRFVANNFEIKCRFPLIERGIGKTECFEILQGVGLELPLMYRLGYKNANCIMCVKGGMGYANKVRRDFPDDFWRMARLERKLGASCINGVFLDELDPNAGRNEDLNLPECGLFCGQNEHIGITA